MNSEHIEKLKREYTDKYVAVDGSRPELARFKDVVGLVRTVNMSGRALVEFFEYHVNIGWYDIDVDYLKLVEKPQPKVKEAKGAAKAPAVKPEKTAAKPAAPAGEKKLSPLEMARAMDAKKKAGAAAPAKAATGGGKMSTTDILAAARGGQAPKAEAVAEKPKPAADPKKMSTADILAAARGEKAAPAAKAKQTPAPAKPQTPAAEKKAPSRRSQGGSFEALDGRYPRHGPVGKVTGKTVDGRGGRGPPRRNGTSRSYCRDSCTGTRREIGGSAQRALRASRSVQNERRRHDRVVPRTRWLRL
jgi:hypothetical protein